MLPHRGCYSSIKPHWHFFKYQRPSTARRIAAFLVAPLRRPLEFCLCPETNADAVEAMLHPKTCLKPPLLARPFGHRHTHLKHRFGTQRHSVSLGVVQIWSDLAKGSTRVPSDHKRYPHQDEKNMLRLESSQHNPWSMTVGF